MSRWDDLVLILAGDEAAARAIAINRLQLAEERRTARAAAAVDLAASPTVEVPELLLDALLAIAEADDDWADEWAYDVLHEWHR